LRGLWEALDGTDVEINKPEGGFFIWIKLPSGTNPNQLAELAAEARVQYTRGRAFFPNGGGEQFIRLSFSYDTAENLYEGAKVMGRLIRESIM